MRLTETQRLALQAIDDGSLDYANPRTINALIDRGLVVYLGSGGERGRRSYRLTEDGDAELRAGERRCA